MIIIDTISYLISVIISIFFYSIPFHEALWEVNWLLIIGGGVFFILSIYNYNGYKNHIEFSQLNQISALLKSSILTITISIIGLFILSISLPVFLTLPARIVFVLSLIATPIFLRQLFGSIIKGQIIKENIIIYGAGEIGLAFTKSIQNKKNDRFNLIGFVDDQNKEKLNVMGIPILGNMGDIDSICHSNDIDRIIVAIRNVSEEKLIVLEQKAVDLNVKINYLPHIESFLGNPGKLKEFSGLPLITRNVQSQSFFYSIGKRIVDIASTGIGILVTSPFWLIIPLLIKKEDGGPALFSQERVGLNGKKFQIYKFRSMKIDTPKYANCPTGHSDPRVTKIGKWLRKTSLDELPQLLNIFKGDMSLVGPRPEMPFIVDDYNVIERKRLLVKPGLTGLWQVSPYRNSEINHNLEYDFYYIENQSFILDFVILVMTVYFVIRGITH